MKFRRAPRRHLVPASPGLEQLERIANDAAKVAAQLEAMVADLRQQTDPHGGANE